MNRKYYEIRHAVAEYLIFNGFAKHGRISYTDIFSKDELIVFLYDNNVRITRDGVYFIEIHYLNKNLMQHLDIELEL